MSDKQYHKLLFWFIMSVVMIGVVIVLLIAILNKPKDVQVNNYVGQRGETGLSGKDGYTPIKGIDYFDGINTISTNTIIEKQITNVVEHYTTETIVEKQNTEVPIKGDKGDSAPQILIQTDYNRCVIQTKYDGDDMWTDIAQLPKPCEVSNE